MNNEQLNAALSFAAVNSSVFIFHPSVFPSHDITGKTEGWNMNTELLTAAKDKAAQEAGYNTFNELGHKIKLLDYLQPD